MLVMYSRFHNYVVEKLAAVNEGGRFSPNRRLSPEDAEKQRDEDLFQTGRLITCGSSFFLFSVPVSFYFYF